MSQIKLLHQFLPILVVSLIIAFGMVIGPRFFETPSVPLEMVFFLAATYTIGQLLFMGFKWKTVQDAVIDKLAKGFPAILILFAIGIIIGSWIVSGTIPMLVYFGIKIINPTYIYLLAFVVPIIFSTLTGTSWGSVGTIGAVIMGIAIVIQADPGITAGAIIGGAYFGDKISPLSDTTNMAAIATEVDLYDHIRSMMYTTLPSAIIAVTTFFILGFVYPPLGTNTQTPETLEVLDGISTIFNFNILLLIPPIIVLYGSFRKMPALPVLITSSMCACLLAFILQSFSATDIIASIHKGFDVKMVNLDTNIPDTLIVLFNRGGMYELNEAIMFTFMVFVFIGALDVIDAMPSIVSRSFSFIKNRTGIILSSLLASAFTNAATSNQSAVSFIVGDAFKSQYDKYGISRKVLSRSIEDYGTMIESIIPWTATTVFMTATLGVPFSDYWHWQLLSLINLMIAPMIAILGIGCFYDKENKKPSHQHE